LNQFSNFKGSLTPEKITNKNKYKTHPYSNVTLIKNIKKKKIKDSFLSIY